MKNLAQYIEDLIIKHECVIVPGLGGFLTYRDSARIHNNQLHAPTERIRFNSLLTHHDGLLAEAYMQDRHISYNDAINAIKQDVEQIKSSLSSNNIFLLGRIGSLTKHNNTISLNDNPKLLPENIGLPSVTLKQLSNTANNSITINIPHSSNKGLRYVASIAIIVLVIIFIPTQINHTSHYASLAFKSIFNTKTETPTNHQQQDIIKYLQESTQNTPKEPTITSSINNRYHLIVASLTSLDDAQKYISQQKHFDPAHLHIIESDGKYRISARSFSKYDEAIQYVNNARIHNSATKKAWILCK